MRPLLVALFVLATPALALADDPAPPVHELGPVYITPRRPHVFVMMHRARVRFDRVEHTHHAVDQIVDSVTHAPF